MPRKITPQLTYLLHELHQQEIPVNEQAQLVAAQGFRIEPRQLSHIRSDMGLRYCEPAVPWCPEEALAAKDLLAAGVSYAQVAAELNKQFNRNRSKNAVIGYAHRNGLVPPERMRAPRKPRKPRKPRARLSAPAKKPKPVVPAVSASEREEAFNGIGKPLVELGPNACRWPLEKVGNQQTFCGADQHTRSYCQHHYRLSIK